MFQNGSNIQDPWPSVKTSAAGPEDEILQMFLTDDTVDSFEGRNSCKNSIHFKMHESTHFDMNEQLSTSDHEASRDKEKPVFSIFDKDSLEENGFSGKGKTNDDSEVKSYDKPSRRSLRLKAGKRSTPSFSYKMYSDDEDLTAETEMLNDGTVVTQNSSTTKSKSTSGESVRTKLYPCDMCSVTCKTAFNLTQHKQAHNSVGSFICTQCDYRCNRKSDLRKHEETHGPKNLYKCLECDYSGKRLKYLKKHMRIHSRDVSFSCHLCEYRSQNKASLDDHLLQHSNQKPLVSLDCEESLKQKSGEKKQLAHLHDRHFLCVVCGAAFKRKYHLKRHQTRHKSDTEIKQIAIADLETNKHRKVTGDLETNKHGKVTGDLETNKHGKVTGDLETNKDGKVTGDLETNKDGKVRKGHDTDNVARGGDGESTHRFTNLNFEDSNKNSEKNNKISEVHKFMKPRGGPMQCTLCSYSCTSKTFLQRHIRRHSDDKPYICSQCGASFKRKDHLEVHKFTHSGLRPYKCPHCLYGTHRKYRLKLHILTHQTVKPIKCSLCTYNCRRDCELRYHMRNKHGQELAPESQPKVTTLAAGNTEFKCKLCQYTCDSQKRMKYHMARHDNKTPHSCPHCDYKCSSRSSLTDHLLQHAGIKPCLCSVCGMAFRNTSRLNRHKLVHSDIKPYGCNFCDFSSRSRYNLKQHILRHTDQERARRRNKKPLKLKTTLSNSTEVLKQSCPTDIQSLLGHVDSDLHFDNVKPNKAGSQMTQNSKNSSKFLESFQSVSKVQYIDKNHVDITYEHYKQQDRHLEHNDSSSCNSSYQNPDASMHSYHFETPQGPGAVNPTLSYSDPYQTPNSYLGHHIPVSYNSHVNARHTNPNFYYMDRNGSGYGFASTYFYSETVFPGNMNSNMNYYVCPRNSSTYSVNSSETLPMNQNFAHVNPPACQINASATVAPQDLLNPVTETRSQSVSEADDAHLDTLKNESVSLEVLLDQESDDVMPSQPKSQAKKTGATLDEGKVSTKIGLGEKASKSTLVCSECGYICLTNTMLQRHKTTHVDLKPHKCDDCGMTFKRMDHMKAHKRTHNEDKPFSCKHCSYTCSRKYRLKIHEMTHADEHSFSCDVCETVFPAEEELKEHAQIHSAGFAFACDKCDFKCKEKEDMRLHTETHKTFLCEECSYVCRSGREFNSHKRMHSDKEELICSICSYTCDSQKRLKYHMERHENKTPHSCPHCDYKCSSRSSLTDHLLQHEGLKPFLCSSCGMRFRNVSRLNRHRMTHTDVKPHSCDYCPFSSRSRYNLKQHMLRHFK